MNLVMNAIEVLKGPAAITQGPYTTGGAVNLVTTPIPDERRGMLRGEYGSDDAQSFRRTSWASVVDGGNQIGRASWREGV